MKRILTILAFCSLVCLAACEKEIILPWTPGHQGGKEPAEEPETKPAFVWIDASANFQYFANDAGRIASDLKKVKDAGFTDVVVDVRPTEGTVLFRSAVAPATKRLAAWTNDGYRYVNRTATFDYLQAFIDEGHKLGLKVNAAINTFVGGYGGMYGLESEGPIFSGDIPADWATVVNYSDGVRSSYSSKAEGTIFLNPANGDVQDYLLRIIGELAKYDLDGIFLDRCRFDDSSLGSDFSELTKGRFTEYLGHTPSAWPIFPAGTRTNLPSAMTAEQKAWMSFRAKVIHDFVEKASDKVHGTNVNIRFGCYVGAWYSTYYESGVNWAAPDIRRQYSWEDNDYRSTGYADHCDYMLLGCYAAAASIYGNGEWTMQGFCKKARPLLGDTKFAGGPDVGNPTGWEKGGKGSLIPQTIDACINTADGYFVFDLCHIRMYNYWNNFKEGFSK